MGLPLGSPRPKRNTPLFISDPSRSNGRISSLKWVGRCPKYSRVKRSPPRLLDVYMYARRHVLTELKSGFNFRIIRTFLQFINIVWLYLFSKESLVNLSQTYHTSAGQPKVRPCLAAAYLASWPARPTISRVPRLPAPQSAPRESASSPVPVTDGIPTGDHGEGCDGTNGSPPQPP
jgi:hypothetical protein